jgi:hypothetical protein
VFYELVPYAAGNAIKQWHRKQQNQEELKGDDLYTNIQKKIADTARELTGKKHFNIAEWAKQSVAAARKVMYELKYVVI